MGQAVLIVADDEEARAALAAFVEFGGYVAVTAIDVRAALEHLQDGLRPSVILLDVAGDDAGGVAFRKQQLTDPELSDIPVILLPGADDVRAAAMRLGAIGYFHKPFDAESVLSLLVA